MQVLAMSGSLRAASINSAFCRAAARLAPSGMQVLVFNGLGGLPLFNPDAESNPPVVVQDFRHAVTQASGLLIASPEYAHGVSGVMKNALDWLVSHPGAAQKPIALVNTSARAHHAYDALKETLQTMAMHIVPEASMTLPLLGGAITEEAILADAGLTQGISAAMQAFAQGIAINARANV